MSHTHAHPSTSSSSNFQSVLDAALEAYEKKTKTKLLDHPLAAQLQSCDSPPPSYLSFKTSSSSLITVGGAMRDYQVGLARQSMFYTRCLPLLAKVLVSLVSIDHFPRICTLIDIFQISQPANVVFSGIGVLLLVSIIIDLSVPAVVTLALLRRLKM
jgi:hypothetical protein